MNRREFLGLSVSAGAIAIINAHITFAASSRAHPKLKTGQPARITELQLLTITPLVQMKGFYSGILGLPVSEKDNQLSIIARDTVITFTRIPEKSKRPFYHVAFNIPENKIEKALNWQRKRTAVIHLNPDGIKDQVVNFVHWNAHSVFFLAPAGNLLEYIARHDLENAASGDFATNDILYASEIGLIVDDVIASGNELQKGISIGQYRDPTAGFWPIGDESGLLLMIRKGRVWAGHPNQLNETDIFKTSVTIRNPGKTKWELPGYPYIISSAG